MIGFKLNLDKIEDEFFKNYLKLVESNEKKISPLVTVNGFPIHYSTSYRNIGVLFNGDMASTMLLLLLCRIIRKVGGRTKIHPIYMIRYWPQNSWSDDAVNNIFNYFKLRFPEIIMDINKSYVPIELENTIIDDSTFDTVYFRSYMIYLTNFLKLNVIYNSQSLDVNKKVKINLNNVVKKSTSNNKEIKNVSPFIFIRKNWILAQYENFQEFELSKMIRSCFDNGIKCDRCLYCLDESISDEKTDCFLEYNHVEYTYKRR